MMRLAKLLAFAWLAFVAAAFCGPTTASAQGAEWCAVYEDDGNADCSFFTQQECLTAISGVGGQCQQNVNPSLSEPEPSPILTLPHLFGGNHPARDYSVPPPPGMDPPPPYPGTPSDPQYAPPPPGYPPPPSPR